MWNIGLKRHLYVQEGPPYGSSSLKRTTSPSALTVVIDMVATVKCRDFFVVVDYSPLH